MRERTEFEKGGACSSTMNELQKHILMAISNEGIAMPNALLALSDSPRYAYEMLYKLTKSELLSDGGFLIKPHESGYGYTVRYKAITVKGLQWLIENVADEYEWLNYIPQPIPPFTHTKGISNNNLFRQLKTITASILFGQFNIETMIPENCIDTNDENSYRCMIHEAKNAHYKTLNRKLTDDVRRSMDIYIQSRDIAEQFRLSREEVNQFAFTQHIGLLISCSKSYFVYCTSQNGLKIQNKGIERARLSAMAYLINNGLSKVRENVCKSGIVLCKNINEYKHFFDDNYAVIGNDKTNIGLKGLYASFDKLYIVPINRSGLYLLDNILTYREKLHEIASARIIDNYEGFRKTESRIYELNYNGIPAYIGIDMEQCSLQRLISDSFIALSETNRYAYCIVCYDWQEEYYRRIIPRNVILYSIKSTLLY